MKKVSLYVLIISIIMSMVNIPVNAENTYSPIASYDFESFNSTNRNIYNTQDNTKYTLKAGQYGVWEHKALDDEVNYPQKKYLKQTSGTQWAPITTTLDEAFLNKVNDGFSFDTWFSSPFSKNFVIFQLSSSANTYVSAFYTKEGGIRVYVKAKKSDDTVVYQNYYYPIKLTADEWYHLGFKYDKNEPPKLYINGSIVSYTTADNADGTTPLSIPVNESETVNLSLIEGKPDGVYDYFGSAAYASLNIYDETLAESDFLESFSKTKVWFEPSYNVAVTDGLGEFVTQEDLASVYSSGTLVPKITIDMQSIENTDLESFTKDTVKIYDTANDVYVTYTCDVAEYGKYNILCTGIESGSYRLEIDGVKDVDGNLIRETKQTLDFGIYFEEEPTLIASYDMKDKYNKINSELYPIGDSIRYLPITDYQYENTYRIAGVWRDKFDAGILNDDLAEVGNFYAYGNIAGLAKNLNSATTIDVWAYSVGKGYQSLFSVYDDARETRYKQFTADNGYLQFDDLYDTGVITYKNTGLATIGTGWHHFVFSYIPGAATQSVYIDGTKYVLTPTADISEEAKVVSVPDTGRFYYNGTATQGSRFRLSNMNIYTGATDTFTEALSLQDADNYTKNYDLKLYKDGELITKERLGRVLSGELTAKIATDDISALATAISGKVKLVKADGTEVLGTVTSDTTVNIDFGTVTGGEYTLVIDKDVNERTTDYELDFTVEDMPELAISFDAKKRNAIPITDYEYEDTYRVTGASPAELAENDLTNDLTKAGNIWAGGTVSNVGNKLNGKFTIDTWFYSANSGEAVVFAAAGEPKSTDGTNEQYITYRYLNNRNAYLQFVDLYRKDNGDGTYTDMTVKYDDLTKAEALTKTQKWYHLVFEYIPGAKTQTVYVNGTKYVLTCETEIPEGFEPAELPETGVLHYNHDVDRQAVTINGLAWGNSLSGCYSRYRFSKLDIYTGVLASFTAYLSTKGEDAYYKNYDLKLYNNDVLVTKEALAYVPDGTLVIKITADDVSVLSAAMTGKIKLVKADKTEISGAVTSSDTDVVVTFENVTDGDYKLVIDKAVNERATDYELAFTVGDKPIVTETKVEITGTSVKAVATVASDINSAVLMLAVYDGENRFVGVKMSDTITNQTMETESLELASGYTAKALLVESIATLKPIK